MNKFKDIAEQDAGLRGDETCSPYKLLSHSWEDLWEDKEATVSARFKKPSPQAIKRMQAGAGKDPIKASYNLLLDCVHPEDKEKLAADLEAYPAVVATLSGAILKSCGVSAELGN